MAIETVKQSVDIVEALDHFGVSVPPRGRDPVMVNCPWHEDDTPSLAVYRREGRAWCFGCNKGGDVLDVTTLFLNCDLKEALGYWSNRLGIEDTRHDMFREMQERKRLARIRETAHGWKFGIEKLIPPPPAPQYLERWDGIFQEKDIINGWHYPPSTLRELRGYTEALRGWLASARDTITRTPGLWRHIPGHHKLIHFIVGDLRRHGEVNNQRNKRLP